MSTPVVHPLATLIVVTHNSARWTARQAAALDAQTDRRWSLVVIDNASESSQRPVAAHFRFGVEIIQSESNMGFAGANNVAAAGRRTPYLIFLNPDAFPEPSWFAELMRLCELYPKAAALGSTQVRDGARAVLDGIGDVVHVSGLAYRAGHGKRWRIPPLGETFAACGASMLVRRDAFEAIGGFDERFFCYFEDIDLSFRLRLAGWSILQAPDATIAHVGGGSTSVTPAFSEFYSARNRLWTFVKCMPGALMWLLLPIHLLATLSLAALGPFRKRGLHALRGIGAGIVGIGPIWDARHKVQRSRKASLGAIAGALAWSPDVLFLRRAVIRKIRA